MLAFSYNQNMTINTEFIINLPFPEDTRVHTRVTVYRRNAKKLKKKFHITDASLDLLGSVIMQENSKKKMRKSKAAKQT